MGQESDDSKRYRALAEKLRQTAARATDADIKAAYEQIAAQYDALADSMARIAARGRREQ